MKVVQRATTGEARPTDGWFITIWRLLARYPEILAWDQLWWDSVHDYRAAVAGAARVAQRKIFQPLDFQVGYHFQHMASLTHFLWKAGDDPARVIEYADWVKPSVYPGCSGHRARNSIDRLHQVLLRDLPKPLAREFVSWIMGRDPATEPDLINTSGECAFGPGWVKDEVARIVSACAPRPVHADLGIGIPAGTSVETPDMIAACTEACFEGGAQGILLSRGYLEMKPELLQAAGDVIRRRLPG
jgi:hypothetical protein